MAGNKKENQKENRGTDIKPNGSKSKGKYKPLATAPSNIGASNDPLNTSSTFDEINKSDAPVGNLEEQRAQYVAHVEKMSLAELTQQSIATMTDFFVSAEMLEKLRETNDTITEEMVARQKQQVSIFDRIAKLMVVGNTEIGGEKGSFTRSASVPLPISLALSGDMGPIVIKMPKSEGMTTLSWLLTGNSGHCADNVLLTFPKNEQHYVQLERAYKDLFSTAQSEDNNKLFKPTSSDNVIILDSNGNLSPGKSSTGYTVSSLFNIVKNTTGFSNPSKPTYSTYSMVNSHLTRYSVSDNFVPNSLTNISVKEEGKYLVIKIDIAAAEKDKLPKNISASGLLDLTANQELLKGKAKGFEDLTKIKPPVLNEKSYTVVTINSDVMQQLYSQPALVDINPRILAMRPLNNDSPAEHRVNTLVNTLSNREQSSILPIHAQDSREEIAKKQEKALKNKNIYARLIRNTNAEVPIEVILEFYKNEFPIRSTNNEQILVKWALRRRYGPDNQMISNNDRVQQELKGSNELTTEVIKELEALKTPAPKQNNKIEELLGIYKAYQNDQLQHYQSFIEDPSRYQLDIEKFWKSAFTENMMRIIGSKLRDKNILSFENNNLDAIWRGDDMIKLSKNFMSFSTKETFLFPASIIDLNNENNRYVNEAAVEATINKLTQELGEQIKLDLTHPEDRILIATYFQHDLTGATEAKSALVEKYKISRKAKNRLESETEQGLAVTDGEELQVKDAMITDLQLEMKKNDEDHQTIVKELFKKYTELETELNRALGREESLETQLNDSEGERNTLKVINDVYLRQQEISFQEKQEKDAIIKEVTLRATKLKKENKSLQEKEPFIPSAPPMTNSVLQYFNEVKKEEGSLDSNIYPQSSVEDNILNDSMQKILEEKNTVQRENTNFIQQIKTLQEEKQTSESINQQAQQQIKTLQEEQVAAQQHLVEKSTVLESAQQQIEEISVTIKQLKDEISKKDKEIAVQKEEIENLPRKITEYKKNIKTLEEQISKLEFSVKLASESKSDFEGRIRLLQDELLQSRNEAAKLKVGSEALELDLTKQRESYELELNAIQEMLKENITKLEDSGKQTLAQTLQYNENINRLEHRIKTLQEEQVAAQQHLVEKSTALGLAQQQIEKISVTNQQAQEQIQAKQQEIDQIKQVNGSLKTQIAALKENATQAEQNITNLRNENQGLAERIETQAGEVKKQLAEIEHLKKDKEDNAGRISELEAKIHNAENKLQLANTTASREAQEKAAIINQLEQKITVLNQQKAGEIDDNAKAQIDLLARQLTEEKERHAEANRQRDAENEELTAQKNTELNTLKNEMRCKEQEYAESITELETRITELKTRSTAATQATEEASSNEITAREESSKRFKELESKDKELESKDKELESKDKELESKDKELEARDKELEFKKQELASKNKELEARDKEFEAKDKELESQKQELAELTKKHNSIKEQAKESNLQAIKDRDEAQRLQNDLKEEITALRTQLGDAQRVMPVDTSTVNDEELEALKQEMAALRTQLGDAQRVMPVDTSTVNDEELEALKQEMAALRTQLGDAQRVMPVDTSTVNDEELEALKQEMAALRTQLGDAQRVMPVDTSTVNDEELEALKQEMAALRTQLGDAQRVMPVDTSTVNDEELEALKQEMAALRTQLGDAQRVMPVDTSTVNDEELEALKQEMAALRTQLGDAQRVMPVDTSTVNDEELEALKQEITALKTQLGDAQRVMPVDTSMVNDEKLEALKQKMARLETELTEAKKAVAVDDSASIVDNAAVANLKEENKTLKEAIKEAHSARDTAITARKAAEDKLVAPLTSAPDETVEDPTITPISVMPVSVEPIEVSTSEPNQAYRYRAPISKRKIAALTIPAIALGLIVTGALLAIFIPLGPVIFTAIAPAVLPHLLAVVIPAALAIGFASTAITAASVATNNALEGKNTIKHAEEAIGIANIVNPQDKPRTSGLAIRDAIIERTSSSDQQTR